MSASAPAPVPLPANLQANPRLSRWIALPADGTVHVRVGKVELGQGIATALAQLAAAELGVDFGRIRMLPADTWRSPDEGVTAGSLSVAFSGAALRQACAEARELLRAAAAARLDADPASLTLADGHWRAPGGSRACSHWELAAEGGLLEVDACGAATPQAEPDPALVGRSLPRLDLPDKVAGRPRFIHDLRPPGLRFGRVLRPPSPAARLLAADLDAVRALPGVLTVLRDGRFLGLVADDEWRAENALQKLAAVARWDEQETLPDARALPAFLRGARCETTVFAEQAAAQPLPPAARRFSARYSRPFLAHASIGCSCALARWNDDAGASPRLAVWTHSQGIFNLRNELALVLGLPAQAVAVQHVEAAGCYGHNGADDAACDAALLARARPGETVRVQWSREDELACSPFGAAMAVELQAELDAQGRLLRWQHEVWSNGHSSRPGRGALPVLLAATHLEGAADMPAAINMPRANGGGAERNSVPLYAIPEWRAVCHRVLEMPLRTSSLRSLGAHANVFASESFVDEIAAALGEDPLAFRLRHLGDDPRARTVLERAAAMAGWAERAAHRRPDHGLGLAVSRYKNVGAWCAAVAEVDLGGQAPRVTRLWLAADLGLVVNPDGVRNQLEGGAIQTVSWVLKEQVLFDRTRVDSRSWEQYPILRFSEVPAVEIALVERPRSDKPLGAGEATHGPVAAAIANAVADGLGLRVRDLPFTAEALAQAALEAP